MNQPQKIPVRRALLSVSDKTGVVDFARGLSDLGIIQEDLLGKEQIFATMKATLEQQERRVKQLLDGRVALITAVADRLLENERVSGEWFRGQLQTA